MADRPTEETREELAAALETLRREFEELQASEAMYRRLVEDAADVIWTADSDLRLTFISPAVERLRGHTVEEAMALSLSETQASGSLEKATQLFVNKMKLISEGDERAWDPVIFEAEMRRKGGGTVFTRSHIRFFEGADGRLGGLIGVTRDDTENRRARNLAGIQRHLAIQVAEAQSLSQVLEICLDHSIRAGSMDAGSIFMIEGDGGLKLAKSYGLNQEFVRANTHHGADSELSQQVIAGQPVYADSEPSTTLLAEGLRSLAVVPIKNHGRVIACLYVMSRGQDCLHQTAQNALESIGSQIGSHIAQSQALEALSASEARHQAIFEHANDGIILMTSVFVDCNRKTLEMFGCSREQLVGHSPIEFSPTIQPDGITSRDKAAAKIEAAMAGDPQVFEWQHKRLDGSTFDAEVSLNRVKLPTGVRLQSMVRDISDRKYTDAVIQFEAGFRRVLGEVTRDFISLPLADIDDGIVRTLGSVGTFINADRGFIVRFDFEKNVVTRTHQWHREGFERSQQDLPIEEFQEIIAPLLALQPVAIPSIEELPACAAREVLEAQGVQSILLVPLLSQGQCVGALVFQFVESAHEFSDKVISLLEFASATLSSALERKRHEEEKRGLQDQLHHSLKMEAIGRLAGGVAHDFNNMLSVILGHAELLLARISDEATRTAIEQIRNAATQSANLTRQLLAFSRKQIVEPKIVNLNDVLGDLRPMLSRLIGEHIQLRTIPSPLLGAVRVDPGQMEQILLNLVVNARDALPQGGEISIETANVVDESGRCIKLAVSDTGHGMSPEIQARIFEPFFTTKELGRGTGLGLATIYGIVKQNGARIEVESKEGVGTSFQVYFPRVAEAVVSELRSKEIVRTGGRETVLVVEDEDGVRGMAKDVLELLGYTVLAVASGQEAIDLVTTKQAAIDLLLTDVVMPKMNGRELAERLQQLHPSLKVLFASGYTRDVIAHRGVIDDGIQFISKPFTIDLLADKVRRVLDSG